MYSQAKEMEAKTKTFSLMMANDNNNFCSIGAAFGSSFALVGQGIRVILFIIILLFILYLFFYYFIFILYLFFYYFIFILYLFIFFILYLF